MCILYNNAPIPIIIVVSLLTSLHFSNKLKLYYSSHKYIVNCCYIYIYIDIVIVGRQSHPFIFIAPPPLALAFAKLTLLPIAV